MRNSRFIVPVLVAGVLSIAATQAIGAPIVFQAGDPAATPGSATPNSNAAAAAFDAAAAALGTNHLITFESAPLGTFASLVIAPGVTVSGTGFTGSPSHQIGSGQARSGCGNVCGFNTTAGGARYIDVDANFITFTFTSGISAFGAYVTGLQSAGETISFNDGSTQSFAFQNFGSGAQFFGFTDAGKSITSIVIDTRNPSNSAGDFIGIDDVRYTTAATVAAVPEPSALALFGIALAGLALARRRKQ